MQKKNPTYDEERYLPTRVDVITARKFQEVQIRHYFSKHAPHILKTYKRQMYSENTVLNF